MYTILPSLLFSLPLSLPLYFPSLFYFTTLDRSIPGWGKKTRNESKQSSIDNVCAVRLTVRIVFPRSLSRPPFFFYLSIRSAYTIERASRRTPTRAQLTPPLFSLFVSVLVWPGNTVYPTVTACLAESISPPPRGSADASLSPSLPLSALLDSSTGGGNN